MYLNLCMIDFINYVVEFTCLL